MSYNFGIRVNSRLNLSCFSKLLTHRLVQDPLSQQLSWTKPPLHVLVLKKICNALFEPFNEIVRYLIYEHNLIVYVEENDFEHEIFRLDEQIKAAMAPRGNQLKPSLRKFCQPSPNYCCRNTENTDVNKIDLVVCLGGDGTLLHASGLFQVFSRFLGYLSHMVLLVCFYFLEKLSSGFVNSYGIFGISLSV